MSSQNLVTGSGKSGRGRKPPQKPQMSYMPSGFLRRRMAAHCLHEAFPAASSDERHRTTFLIHTAGLRQDRDRLQRMIETICTARTPHARNSLGVSIFALTESLHASPMFDLLAGGAWTGTPDPQPAASEEDDDEDPAAEDSFKRALRELHGTVDPDLDLEF